MELKSGTWENGSITLEDGDAKIQNTKLSGDVSVENSYGCLLYTSENAISLAGLTGNERVMDAYCGIGTISLIASGDAREVISVEPVSYTHLFLAV